jgi:REP element-mobilizing transposase RayT
MLGLLTWPAYGTWFARPDRGWIDRDGDEAEALAEPTRRHDDGRQRLVWPPVRLDERQQTVVIQDLARIASLRHFDLHMVAAAPDHVHVLLSCEPDRDVPRLVQLIKGALSRALTVAAGDEPARSTRGQALIHHKWWTRQYSFRWIEDRPTLERAVRALRAHAGGHATVWEATPPAAGACLDMRE